LEAASDAFLMESTAATAPHRDTILVRAPDLRVCFAGDGFGIGSAHDLAVLDCFTVPRTIADAMQLLGSRCGGPQEWADLGGTIRRLHRDGLLHEAGRVPPRASHPGRFDRPGVHTRMLNDRMRTGLYLEALREVVRLDDIVVDLGTGSGVLAVAAAQLGARRVYAIESSSMAAVAERVADVNGVSDRVTVVRGQSVHVTLPERATLVVSEIIGNDPLAERVLEALRDARTRLCQPDAQFIPSSLELFLLPLAVDQEHVARHLPTADRVDAWRRWYGIDLSPLQDMAPDGWEGTWIQPREAAAFEMLGPPVSLGALTLGDACSFPIERHVSLSIERAGTLGGIVLYFEAQLSPGVRLSLDPRRPSSSSSSWMLPVWLRVSPLVVQAGETLDCHYRYAGASELTIRRSARDE
jgi:hypothetical protein